MENKTFKEALWATPEYKKYKEAVKAKDKALNALIATPACEALWATPEYKAFEEAVKAEDEAYEAMIATPAWKAYDEAEEGLNNGK